MKIVFIIIFMFVINVSSAQIGLRELHHPVFNGPTQVGNNNTQNNYVEKELNEQAQKELWDFIYRLQLDSAFFHVKYFNLGVTPYSNGAKVSAQIYDFLTKKGLINGTIGTHYFDGMLKGVAIELSPRDSTITVTVGVLE